MCSEFCASRQVFSDVNNNRKKIEICLSVVFLSITIEFTRWFNRFPIYATYLYYRLKSTSLDDLVDSHLSKPLIMDCLLNPIIPIIDFTLIKFARHFMYYLQKSFITSKQPRLGFLQKRENSLKVPLHEYYGVCINSLIQ